MHTRLAILLAAALLLTGAPNKPVEWEAYGGNAESTRYSPLKQINRTNVGKLELAWQYDPGERGASQVNPIIAGGVLYAPTPGGKLIALDAATGKVKWSWDSKTTRNPSRGVTWWSDGKNDRILAGFGRYVYSINAKSGAVDPGFGKEGRIDLHQDLGRDPERQSVTLTTPGIIYKDLLIVGGRTSEGLPASPGDVRAYDVHTGALRWSFHTIPHPGEFGYDTWPKDAWTTIGSANNWAGMSVDLKRGIVYVPTGSAAADFYGANRVGDNLFANSLLALKADTGERIWHFQAVKHDIWDRDFDSPPTLVTVKSGGKNVDAVAQTTKQGVLFLFDRATGKPLFPIEYRKVPPSTVDGEVAAETQPFPVKPAPFARQLLTAGLLTNRTPEAHQWALEEFKKFRNDGQFVPLEVGRETVVFPGFDGGAEWGGSAFDPETGIIYINANDLAWSGSLTPARNGVLKYSFTGYHKWLDPDGYPATAPPWGTLNAINLNTGDYAWKIPFGEYPELVAKGLKDTGSENYGGPVVTAGGIVFIAATNFDRKLRAFDKANGKLLWETTMVNSGNSTPATYEVNGRQFVVVAAFGGKNRNGPTGGAFVAYALPQPTRKL